MRQARVIESRDLRINDAGPDFDLLMSRVNRGAPGLARTRWTMQRCVPSRPPLRMPVKRLPGHSRVG
jgi:hypothetical protein